MKYLTTSFSIKAEESLMQTCRDLLADGAAEAGFEAFEETEKGLDAYVQKELFDQSALDAFIASFPIPSAEITYTIAEAEDKDWNEEWEDQGFAPICINDQVLIYDAKHPELHPTTSPDHIEIGIEAKLAFGTGNHETTRMIVAALLGMNLYKKRILDCGCGTGILGIACSKMGASEVVGYDIDEWSVDNARHNAQLNGVENMEVLHGNASVINHISGIFDIVLANINRNILLEDMRAFRSVIDTGGQVILSGFYESDIPALIQRAEELGLRLSEKYTDNDWACIILTA